MERDLADQLDDLICAGPLKVSADYQYLYNVAGTVFVIWIVVAILVYLAASYLVQSASPSPSRERTSEATTNADTVETLPTAEKTISSTAVSELLEISTPHEEVAAVGLPNLSSTTTSVAKSDQPRSIGSDLEALSWVNQCIENIYTTPSLRSTLVQQWLLALTKYIQSLDVEENIRLTFEGVLPHDSDPKFTNLVTQVLPNENMTMTLDVDLKDVPIKVEILSSGNSSNCLTLCLKHLRGRGSATILSRERMMNAKLEGWPEIHLEIKTGRSDLQPEMLDIIKELTISALRGSQVNINMEDFNNNEDRNPFPVFIRKSSMLNSPPLLSNATRSPKDTDRPRYPTLQRKAKRFLHVCVAKAVNLSGGLTQDFNPYVITELDEPNQRHKTDPTQLIGGTDAHWNQTFTLELSNMSKEVLFEIWNHSSEITKDEMFLGLGIVSVDELMLTQNQRLVVPLQGNPGLSSDDGDSSAVFGGLLTVHFLVTTNCKTSDLDFTAVSPIPESRNGLESPYSPSPINLDDTEDVISDIELDANPSVPSRAARLRSRKDAPSRFKKRLSASASVGQSTTSITPSSVGEPVSANVTPGSKRRSASAMDRLSQFISGIRAKSADRVRSASQNRGAFTSLFAKDDDEESQSDMSAISSASNKTYITEESSLVLECKERGIIKHYMIPYQVAKKGKIRKRGAKLHIYMDHIFTAQHIKGGNSCAVCLTSIPIRLGKQGYVCRDCNLICHKPCHVKVPHHCMETTLPQMELLYYDNGK